MGTPPVSVQSVRHEPVVGRGFPHRLHSLPSGLALLVAALAAVFVYLVLPPFISVVTTSFYDVDARGQPIGLTLRHYADLFATGAVLQPLYNTVIFSLGSATLALVIGGSLALIVARTNTPLRALGDALALLSLSIPFVLYTIAWLLLLGQRGVVNGILMTVFRLADPPVSTYSLGSMVAIEGFLWSPFTFLMLSAVFRTMDPALEEAGLIFGSGVWSTVRNVTLPLARPAVTTVALLVFIRSFESFEIPALVGVPGKVFVLTSRVYADTRTLPPDYGGASAYAVALMGMVLLGLYAYSRSTRQAARFATISGKAFRPRVIDLGRWRYLTSAILVLYFLLLVVAPLAIILWASLVPFYAPPSVQGLGLLTLKNYVAVLTRPNFAIAMRNTLVVGVIAASVVVVLTSLACWIVLRTRIRGRLLLEQVGGLPLVFPGIVLGLAILQIYLRVPIGVYGTLWILVIAFATRYLPYGMRYGNVGLLQVSRELEEAAATGGVGFWRTYRFVVAPLILPSLIAGWVFVFLLATKELAMTVLLSGPQTKMMSVEFFDLWNNGQVTQVAALGVVWAIGLSVVTVAFFLLARRFGLSMNQL